MKINRQEFHDALNELLKHDSCPIEAPHGDIWYSDTYEICYPWRYREAVSYISGFINHADYEHHKDSKNIPGFDSIHGYWRNAIMISLTDGGLGIPMISFCRYPKAKSLPMESIDHVIEED